MRCTAFQDVEHIDRGLRITLLVTCPIRRLVRPRNAFHPSALFWWANVASIRDFGGVLDHRDDEAGRVFLVFFGRMVF
jgi:hypothetical protein